MYRTGHAGFRRSYFNCIADHKSCMSHVLILQEWEVIQSTISKTPNGNGGGYAVDPRRKPAGGKFSVATANLVGGKTLRTSEEFVYILSDNDEEQENNEAQPKSKAGRKPKKDPMEAAFAQLGELASACVTESAATRKGLESLVQTAKELPQATASAFASILREWKNMN